MYSTTKPTSSANKNTAPIEVAPDIFQARSNLFKKSAICSLNQIETLLADHEGTPCNNTETQEIARKLQEVTSEAHVHGYDLLADLGVLARHFLTDRAELAGEDIALMEKTIESFKLILQRDMAGGGGPSGEKMRDRFRQDFPG